MVTEPLDAGSAVAIYTFNPLIQGSAAVRQTPERKLNFHNFNNQLEI